MTFKEYSELHPFEHKAGDCNTCHKFYSEWDEIDRKQVCYCDMKIMEKGHKCPELKL